MESGQGQLGGEEVNTSPTQSNERFAINFGAKPLDEAAKYPQLLEIVRTRVKPQRDRQKDHGPGAHGKKYWWQYALRSDPLYDAIRSLPRCLVSAITTTHFAFSFQPIRQVFAHSMAAFAFSGFGPFACLQSQIHIHWAQVLSSSLGLGLRYSVGDAFQTFPFPENFETDPRLEAAGKAYYEFRAALMVRNNEGLTKTYNRFHDPEETSPEILTLRDLHAAMDRAVLDAYGWKDISTACEFLLDYEEEDEDDAAAGGGKGRKKRKPYRYRWPDAVRDEVLARLLKLNAERAEEERTSGEAGAAKASNPKKPRPKSENSSSGGSTLFAGGDA